MRLRIFSPLPPSPSGIADYVAEQLPVLARLFDVVVVVEDPASVGGGLPPGVRVADAESPGDGDLDLYHVGNSPAHAYVYRAALRRPGVVFLHEFSIHHLVLRETVERGDVSAYLREMRRSYGETGTFVGRQVARALGGSILPALFPLSDRLLESSLAVVGLTDYVCSRSRRRLPGRPVLQLRHHLALPFQSLPSRAESRRALGLPEDAFLVTAPGLATATKGLDRLVRAVARVRSRRPGIHLVVAGAQEDPVDVPAWARAAGAEECVTVTGRLSLDDFVRHLVAADVVVSLRFPSHGEISGALVRALGVGRPCLVTAGTPAAEEFPEGVVIPVDPGALEEEEIVAFLSSLAEDPQLREAVATRARQHVTDLHDLVRETERLASFLRTVEKGKGEALARLDTDRFEAGGLAAYLMEELRWGARDLGLPGASLGLKELVAELVGEPS